MISYGLKTNLVFQNYLAIVENKLIYIKFHIIWKSDLTDKMKRSFSQAAVISILLYGCTIWTLTKRLGKKLDGNYTRMLRAILNKSWRQQPTRHQLYGHLPPITKTIQVRGTRHAGHCWRSRDELISDVHLWIPHRAEQKQDDQLEHTSSNYVRIRDVSLKTRQRRWTVRRSGEGYPCLWHDMMMMISNLPIFPLNVFICIMDVDRVVGSFQRNQAIDITLILYTFILISCTVRYDFICLNFIFIFIYNFWQTTYNRKQLHSKRRNPRYTCIYIYIYIYIYI